MSIKFPNFNIFLHEIDVSEKDGYCKIRTEIGHTGTAILRIRKENE